MKTIILLLTSILLIACGPRLKEEKTLPENSDYTIRILDRCEYIIYDEGHNWSWGTHKGNCNNPIHKCKCDTLNTK